MIRPLRDMVIVRTLESDKSEGGLFIPNQAGETTTRGEVLAIGEGETINGRIIPVEELKVGNIIMFNKFTATEIKEAGNTYKLLSAKDILCILEQ